MAALASTSLVTWFDEDTPLQLITQVRPDILVKGGDYYMQTLAETRVVEAYGGRALALPFVSGYSTTALVRKIRAIAGLSAGVISAWPGRRRGGRSRIGCAPHPTPHPSQKVQQVVNVGEHRRAPPAGSAAWT